MEGNKNIKGKMARGKRAGGKGKGKCEKCKM